MKIKYYYSATVGIITKDISILCDPWFTQGIYYGSWFHYPFDPLEIDRIEKYDYIFISHLHEDHCDIRFIKKYLKAYNDTKIIISERPNNYLSKILDKNNIDYLKITSKTFGETFVDLIIDNSRGSSSIDSILVVRYKSNFYINANDCEVGEQISNKISKLKEKNIDYKIMLSIGYAGANDWPHMYLNYNKSNLIKASSRKQKLNINKFIKGVDYIKPHIVHPFAGQYILGGKLYKYNSKRGIPDPIILKNIFKKVVILKEYRGLIDLEKDAIFNERLEPYDINKLNKYCESLSDKKFDYETDEVFIDKENIKNKLTHAYNKIQDTNNYDVNIDIYTKYIQEKDFNKSQRIISMHFKGLNIEKEKISYKYIIDPRLLSGLIAKRYHWDNCIIGSHIFTERTPDIDYRIFRDFLNFI